MTIDPMFLVGGLVEVVVIGLLYFCYRFGTTRKVRDTSAPLLQLRINAFREEERARQLKRETINRINQASRNQAKMKWG